MQEWRRWEKESKVYVKMEKMGRGIYGLCKNGEDEKRNLRFM